MRINVHKIASVTKNIPLKKKVDISHKIISKEGYVLAVEVLENKKIYNKLELTTGRLSTLHQSNVVVVALGQRRALKGFAGKVPNTLKVGDTINILNIGGVSGICTSENIHEVGHALKVKVLGAVVDKNQHPININDFKLFEPAEKIHSKIPLIVISGTSMDTGKTSVACKLIQAAAREGFKVFSAKMAGIAAMKDLENMLDNGSEKAISVIDAGHTSSIMNAKDSISMVKGAINHLAKGKPDLIVMELGDGILGEYGVLAILKDSEFQKHLSIHISCANDLAGAAKLSEICKEIKIPLHLLSGPVTDNSVGTEFILKNLGIKAMNGLHHGEKIFPYLMKYLRKK